MPLLVIALTGSPPQAGFVTTASMVIGQCASLLGGVIVDWFDRRRLMQIYATIGFTVWGLASLLIATNSMTFWILVATTAVSSLSSGLFGEATNASQRSILPTANYPQAQAANQGRDATIEVASGPLGGFLYDLLIWLPFAVAAGRYLTMVAAAQAISSDLKPGGVDQHKRRFRTDFISRLRWQWESKLLVKLGIVLLIFNLGFQGIYMTFVLTLRSRARIQLRSATSRSHLA